ncbi:ribonuclease E/G domain protein [Parvimonas sp. oral taxon 393 str. F0440]|nr:ribonuclease E/G domain protein [Parvimonas sp. oral taxon 393 str. F0440]
MRTKSVDCDEDTLLNDIRKNVKKMQEIVDSLHNLPVPKLIYKKENFLEDFLFDNEKYCCILNDKEIYKSFKDNKFLKSELKYDEEYSPRYDYNIGVYLEGLNKKIVEVEDINIVIEETEALTVIDVNSKKKQMKQIKVKMHYL